MSNRGSDIVALPNAPPPSLPPDAIISPVWVSSPPLVPSALSTAPRAHTAEDLYFRYPTMDVPSNCPSPKLHTRLRLWEFADRYVFEPVDGLADLLLSVSRVNGSMNLIEELPQRGSSTNPKVQIVFGVIGVLKLAVGTYLLVITDRDCVGSYLGHAVFKVTGLRVLPCNSSPSASAEQKNVDTEFSELLDAAERTIGLYFSYDSNLTVTSQRLHELGDEFKSLPLWRQVAVPKGISVEVTPHGRTKQGKLQKGAVKARQVDSKPPPRQSCVAVVCPTSIRQNQDFCGMDTCWSLLLRTNFDSCFVPSQLHQYLLPVIQGSFQSIHAEVRSEKVNVTLIARRCTRRIGTRMWRRGADPEGYAANFVESEQIMQSKGFTASYVQIRGSMPFLWEQIVDLTYKPSFHVVRVEEARRVLERHFHDLQKKYGAVVAIDLVNTHGGEGRLYDRYAKSIEPILSEDIRFVHFDFHKICGHIHFERLSQLYDQIEDYLKKHKYFLLSDKGEKIEQQTGTARTNCVDCLDRTNVTQSMIGRKLLESQLQRIGVFGANDTVSNFPDFDANYKVLWANHGDAISTQYSGTPALKGDFVRYGKRTTQGILNDLWNALARYYLNNFADGTKQDAMDLLQGHYISSVSRDMAAPVKAGLLENYASFRLAFALILVAVMFMIMSLRQDVAKCGQLATLMTLQHGMIPATWCCHLCGLVFASAYRDMSKPMAVCSAIDHVFTSHAIDRCREIVSTSRELDSLLQHQFCEDSIHFILF
ncbi:phosphoinositide phosphatase SAC7-like isoform X2 [Panicum hallii]|uniref:phosphoinositide phosphatase SAC7-like isoform X2 n=1 Tax=Panicum hallii TaxID=206008 RepID=UPI000DF4D825|nr:phosphoinositide phosphatase SAC7-like isoform X2 [Panicum hallii]